MDVTDVSWMSMPPALLARDGNIIEVWWWWWWWWWWFVLYFPWLSSLLPLSFSCITPVYPCTSQFFFCVYPVFHLCFLFWTNFQKFYLFILFWPFWPILTHFHAFKPFLTLFDPFYSNLTHNFGFEQWRSKISNLDTISQIFNLFFPPSLGEASPHLQNVFKYTSLHNFKEAFFSKTQF